MPTRGSAAEPTPTGVRLRRAADAASAHTAISILREASAWAAARGIDMWQDAELSASEFEAAAANGELILGFEGAEAAATMLLQSVDTVYWPEKEPGSALYVHKVAVRRAFAGRGWLPRLIDFAEREACARGIGFLRLDTVNRPKMRAMYEQLGFRILVEPPIMMYGRAIIRLERQL